MHDVAIIGGGPGGYAAALYAHNFGLSVALVEKQDVGGTCLHRGCIPAKSWIHTAEVFAEVAGAAEVGVISAIPTLDWTRARERKDAVVSQLHKGLLGLLKQRKVEIVAGTGRLSGPGVVDVAGDVPQRLEARKVIVATGAVPRSIPGYEPDGQRIVTSDHALDWSAQPGRVAIIGAGAIGVEFACLLAEVGTEVHLFEAFDQVLPGVEPEAAQLMHRMLTKKGIKITTGATVSPPVSAPGGVRLSAGGAEVEVDVVLVAVGRAPVTAGLGLEEAGVRLDRGYVVADRETMLTDAPEVYAVGDIVAGTPQLAHAGFAEGIAAITHIATGVAAPVDYRAIPLVVYSIPEVASVGRTEAQAASEGYDVVTTDHGIGGVARAIIKGQTQGLVKIVAERGGPILGATVVGPQAGEMIHELMYAVGWEALPAEAAAFIHAHPTLSEAVGESLLAAAGRSLH